MSLEKDYKYLYLKYKNKYLSLKNPISGNEIIDNLKTELNLSNFYNIPQYAGFFFDDDSDKEEEEEIIDNFDLLGGSEDASHPATATAPATAPVEANVVSDTSSLAGMSDLDAVTEEKKPDDSSKKSQEGGAKKLDDLDSLSDSMESLSISDTQSSEDSY
jgi:hypothetical protein